MKVIHETHCHSLYSGDVDKTCGASIDALCETALALGLGSIAITDHLEIHQTMGHIFPPLDHEGIRRDIRAARETYEGKLEVVYGVELAQACHDLEQTNRTLSRYPYDFIIGSVHAVRGFPDFSDLDYPNVSDEMLKKAWGLYLAEQKELIDFENFDTLAHITYPYRYFKRAGRDALIDIFKKGRDYFETPFKRIIEKGIALEVNTSGLRQDTGTTFPHTDLIRFYRELGGDMVTVGSDAHYAKDLAADIRPTVLLLKELGFKNVFTFRERKPVPRKL